METIINYLSPGNDLRKVETSDRCSISILKLHIEIVHLNGNNKVVYQIMRVIDNNINLKKECFMLKNLC